MNRAIISLGSNIADKETILQHTLCNLDYKIVAATPPYIDSCDNNNDSPYMNIIAIIDTNDDCAVMKSRFKEIEKKAGRRPQDKETGIIPLDIDIVIFNNEIIRPTDYNRPYFKHGYSLLINTRP